VFRSVRLAIQEKRLPQASKSGITIALLGFFCPLFWIPFLSGKPVRELRFDIIHSGIFVVIGIGMFLCGILAQRRCK
jgi:quinol-cytochrome oxidoreductase complex cytochrome b subunit